MKKMLIVCAILLVVSAGAHSLPPRPYVGLFADAGHSVTSANGYGGFMPFELWIWWLPSEHGFIATEFKLTYPSNVIAATVTSNPELQLVLGCIGYLCPIFVSCRADWAWTHHQSCFLLDALPSVIEIGPPRPGESIIAAANCELGYPLEPVTIFNKFGINQDAVIAVEPQSWGAIKNLYR